MTSMTSSGVPVWMRSARDLYLVAIAVFVVNIVIGILNGADAVEFDRNQILTHVHAGTVGWLTLAIVAAATLLFRATDRRLVVALAITVPVYVLAFYTGNFPVPGDRGTVLLLVIAWLLVWLWREFLAGERSLPRLAVTLGLTSFGYGAVLGVLLQIAFAAGVTIVPGDAIGAHASAMTFGYLVLVAFGVLEWRILGTRDLPHAGLVQIVALFLGGLVISIALLAGAEQAGGGIYLLTQLIAVALFVIRIWPTSLRTAWLRRRRCATSPPHRSGWSWRSCCSCTSCSRSSRPPTRPTRTRCRSTSSSPATTPCISASSPTARSGCSASSP